MTEEQFIKLRQADWQAFEAQLDRLRRQRHHSGGVAGFPAQYRRLCQDLNQARACLFSLNLVEQLNHLVWAGHQELYCRTAFTRRSFIRIVLFDFPARVRQEFRTVLVGHLLFYGLALLVFFYITGHPATLDLFMSGEQQADLAALYDPASEHFMQPRETSGSADMFGYYIINNIGIGCRTFAGGALAGIGSLFFLAFNALFMGAATACIVKLGYTSTFFPFIITHSAFELSALILFAVAGLRIGWAWVAPGQLDRRTAFAKRSQEMIPLLAGSFLFLVIAAVIEAFWSSMVLPASYKYGSGALAWALVGLFLVFGGRQHAPR